MQWCAIDSARRNVTLLYFCTTIFVGNIADLCAGTSFISNLFYKAKLLDYFGGVAVNY